MLHALVVELGAHVVHAPEEAGWVPGYYSLLFEDPDGIRLEVDHVPGRGVFEPGVQRLNRPEPASERLRYRPSRPTAPGTATEDAVLALVSERAAMRAELQALQSSARATVVPLNRPRR